MKEQTKSSSTQNFQPQELLSAVDGAITTTGKESQISFRMQFLLIKKSNPMIFYKAKSVTVTFSALWHHLLKTIIESKISSHTFKFNPMESIWPEYFIAEFSTKLLSMTSFLLMLKTNLYLLNLQEETKFGLSFSKNAGLNSTKVMPLFQVDSLIKSYTLFLELPLYSITCPKVNNNKINFSKYFFIRIKMELFYVAEQNLISKSKKKDLSLVMLIL